MPFTVWILVMPKEGPTTPHELFIQIVEQNPRASKEKHRHLFKEALDNYPAIRKMVIDEALNDLLWDAISKDPHRSHSRFVA
jgi:hypothetical protein